MVPDSASALRAASCACLISTSSLRAFRSSAEFVLTSSHRRRSKARRASFSVPLRMRARSTCRYAEAALSRSSNSWPNRSSPFRQARRQSQNVDQGTPAAAAQSRSLAPTLRAPRIVCPIRGVYVCFLPGEATRTPTHPKRPRLDRCRAPWRTSSIVCESRHSSEGQVQSASLAYPFQRTPRASFRSHQTGRTRFH